ncbi:hypothetical protein AAF712_010600 [Marasmius tenuissimus]|uniref:F-box domain-containing protein n=1 Tax=Marasmius tenuissimus TaxID=585030 RepID=A0ABR2ZLV7_9AGAR
MWFTHPGLPQQSKSRELQDNKSPFSIELYGEIAQYLGDADKLSLCLTSKSICSFVLPYLYSNLRLNDSECLLRIRFLIARPYLSRFVREIVLVPSNVKQGAMQKSVAGEVELARAVELLAPNLTSLEKFIWDGLEVPDDNLWLALQRCCPLLRTVGTNLGTRPISPESQLFAFDNLLGFWLSSELRDTHYGPNLEHNQGEKLPSAFWDMLINRSPNLRSLTLGYRGPSLQARRTLDITPMVDAKWPKLTTLVLENCRLEEPSEQEQDRPSLLQSFTNFIFSHQSLKHLSVHGLPDLGYRQALKHLKSLSCAISIGALPLAINTTIEELTLTDEPYNGIAFHAFREYVSTLPSLKKLSLWMDFTTEDPLATKYGQIHELRSLVTGCPRLEHLTVICSTKPKESFHLRDFSQVLKGTTLKSIELWKCHRAGDDGATEVAETLFREHVALEAITLRLVHGHRRRRSDSLRIMQSGLYRVRRATDGKPEHIFVHEKAGKWLPWIKVVKLEQDLNRKPDPERQVTMKWLWNKVRGYSSSMLQAVSQT